MMKPPTEGGGLLHFLRRNHMHWYGQSRVCITARLLVDAELDWLQITVEAKGVDPRHLLLTTVHHPERLHDLGPVMARLCTELVDVVRTTTRTEPSSSWPSETHER